MVAKYGLLASGLAALIGGAIGVLDLRYVYLLSVGAAITTLAFVIAMREATSHKRVLVPDGPVRQTKACVRLLRQPMLAWLFVFYVLMTVLNHVPYEFYQPYIALVLEGRVPLGDGTSLSTGVHVSVVMVIAAWFAGRSIHIRDRIGLGGVLLAAAVLQTLIIGVMGLVLHPLIILLMLLRTVPRALMAAPLNAVITPRVGRAQRATFLSIQSVAGRMAFSGFLVVLSMVTADARRWTIMSRQLLISAGVGFVGVVILSICWHQMAKPQDL